VLKDAVNPSPLELKLKTAAEAALLAASITTPARGKVIFSI